MDQRRDAIDWMNEESSSCLFVNLSATLKSLHGETTIVFGFKKIILSAGKNSKQCQCRITKSEGEAWKKKLYSPTFSFPVTVLKNRAKHCGIIAAYLATHLATQWPDCCAAAVCQNEFSGERRTRNEPTLVEVTAISTFHSTCAEKFQPAGGLICLSVPHRLHRPI